MSNKERVNSETRGHDVGLEVRRFQRLMREEGVISGFRSALPGAIENLRVDTQERLAEFLKNKVLRFSHSFSLDGSQLSSDRFGQARDTMDEAKQNFISPSKEGGTAMSEIRKVGSFFSKLGKGAGQAVCSYYDCYGRLPGIFLRSYTKEKNSQKVEQKNIYLRITQEEREKLQEKISQRMETQELKNDKGETVNKLFVTDREENFLDLKDVVQMLKTTLSPQRQEELSGWLANFEKVAAEEGKIKADPQASVCADKEIKIGVSPSGISLGRERPIGGAVEFKEPKIKKGNNPEPSPELTAKESLAFLSQGKVVARQKMALSPLDFQEKPQGKQLEFLSNQPEILATSKSSLHNFQRSLENVQFTSITENEEISVGGEQIFIERERQPFLPVLAGQRLMEMEQEEVTVETADQLTTRKEAVPEVSTYVHPGGVNRKEVESSVAVERLSEDLQLKESVERETVMTEREEVVVFEAAEPVTELVTSVSEPFAFIRNEPRIEEKMVPEITTLQLLQQVEEAVLPVLIVPSFEQAEQTVYIEEEISQSIIPRILPRRHKNGVAPHGEVIEKEIPGQEEQKEITENREERIVLPKVEVWTPRIVSLNFSLLQWRESKQQFVDLSTNLISEKFLGRVLELGKKNPNWIELLSPKEISIITAMARDKFGHRPFSSTTLADLALFWLAAMSLLAQKPILYKLELDFTPLTVNVKDGKILVARKAIPEEGLGRESLWAEWRQSLPRPFLSLTA